MNKYLVWYAYQGMETEGRLDLEEPRKIKAKSPGIALFIYHALDDIRNNRDFRFKSLKEYMKNYYAEGGWGYNVVRIHDDEYFQINYDENKLKHLLNE